MEGQIEKILDVIMTKVIEGIPNGKGGYLERPIDTEALRFINDCGGELDAAVAAAAFDVFVRKSKWSDAMWKGALVVVVGQIPLLGSTAAVFYQQFECLWKQIRFIALAATIYGHDMKEDSTQLQAILCLVDDKIRQKDGATAMNSLVSNVSKSGCQVAATVIARQIARSGSTGFLMRRVLGGLMAGVVPEAVGLVYNLFIGAKTEQDKGQRAKELSDRARKHFKIDEQPSMVPFMIALILWAVPMLLMNGYRMEAKFRNMLCTLFGDDVLLGYLDFMIIFGFECLLVALTLKVVCKVGVWLFHSQTWILSALTLGVRSFLSLLSFRNTATSFVLFLTLVYNKQPADESLYHGHRCLVGWFLAASKYHKPLKRFVPYIVASLLVWTLYNVTLCGVMYLNGILPLLQKLIAGESIIYDLISLYEEFTTSRMVYTHLRDAIDAVCAISLHVLVLEIQRQDILMSLLGPKKVVSGILFAGKSLGHVVLSPDSVMCWLDNATPPFLVSWVLLSLQHTGNVLGVLYGFGYQTNLMTVKEVALLTYGILITVPFILWQQNLPAPHEEFTWADALKTRHSLLYLIPDIDVGTRSKLYYAIHFFDQYDSAIKKTKSFVPNQASLSWQYEKFHDWIWRNQKTPYEDSYLIINEPTEMVEENPCVDAESGWKFWVRSKETYKPETEECLLMALEDKQAIKNEWFTYSKWFLFWRSSEIKETVT